MNKLLSEIDVVSVKAMLDGRDEFLLLDCRNQDEYDLARIDGAKLIPMGELEQRVVELDDHRDRHIVVYCHLGGRSQMVCQWLRQLGFSQVQNMTGGIDAWSTRIDSSVARY